MPHPVLEMTDDAYLAYITERGIGGSQVGAIMGVCDYSTPLDIYNSVLGIVPRSRDNNYMTRGRVLEPHVADWYEAKTGRQLYAVPTARDPERAFVRASPDRMIRANTANRAGGVGILEIKALGVPNYRKTRENGVAPAYFAQLQHYLDVLDKNWGAFAIFNADDWDGVHYDVERDDAFIERIHVAVDDFWTNHVLTRTPPSSVVDVDEPVPDIGAEAVRRSDPEWAAAIRALRTATEEKGLVEHRHKQAQTRVKDLMGSDGLVIGGGARVSYRESTRRTLDTDALQGALEVVAPDFNIEEYYRTTATRTFRPTFD